MTTSRRDFLQTLLALGGATAALSAVGCGDDDGPAGSDSGTPRPDGGRTDAGSPTDSGSPDEDAGSGEDAGGTDEDAGTDVDSGTEPACEAVDATIGTNHGHRLEIPPADIAAGSERTYDIRGSSGHAHSVTVSAANFATLAGGETVMLTSTSGGGHTHAVTLVCG